jgi:ATP-dependent Clp protease ATP-binding subunit ClpA
MGSVFEGLTRQARRVLVVAGDEARLLNSTVRGTEHLLLGILHNDEGLAAEALQSFGITLDEARAKVVELAGPAEQPDTDSLRFTPALKTVLEDARYEARQLGHDYVGTAHLLLGLVQEREGGAARVLLGLGADLPAVRQLVLHRLVTNETERLDEELEDRRSNARELRQAIIAAGITVEGLAEASGVERQRLSDAESAEPQVDLTFQEWLRLAVVFEGRAWDEFISLAGWWGSGGEVVSSGQFLQQARHAVRRAFGLPRITAT